MFQRVGDVERENELTEFGRYTTYQEIGDAGRGSDPTQLGL
jgi:hypothetical protein